HACDDVLARRLAERDDHVGYDAWVRLLALSRMVWWAGQEVTQQALRDAPAECERLRVAARQLAMDTAGRFEDLATPLRARAPAHFPPDAIVSSDRLRALVGAGEDDVAAGADAFALLDDVTRRRLARRLTTVIDTLGLDAERRRAWLELARRHDLPCVAVGF